MIFADIYVSFQCLILVFVNRWRSWPMQWWTRCRMVRRHWYKYKSTQIHKYKEKRTSPIQYSHHRDNILARRTKIGFDKSSVCSPVTHSYKQESDEDGKKIYFWPSWFCHPRHYPRIFCSLCYMGASEIGDIYLFHIFDLNEIYIHHKVEAHFRHFAFLKLKFGSHTRLKNQKLSM